MRRLFLRCGVPEVASVRMGRPLCAPVVAGKLVECRGERTPGPRAACIGASGARGLGCLDATVWSPETLAQASQAQASQRSPFRICTRGQAVRRGRGAGSDRGEPSVVAPRVASVRRPSPNACTTHPLPPGRVLTRFSLGAGLEAKRLALTLEGGFVCYTSPLGAVAGSVTWGPRYLPVLLLPWLLRGIRRISEGLQAGRFPRDSDGSGLARCGLCAARVAVGGLEGPGHSRPPGLGPLCACPPPFPCYQLSLRLLQAP